MNITRLGLLLNVFVTVIAGRAAAIPSPIKRYAIAHPASEDPLEDIGYISHPKTKSTVIGAEQWTFADLDLGQVESLRLAIKRYNGAIKPNQAVKLSAKSAKHLRDKQSSTTAPTYTTYPTATPTAQLPTFINAIPYCQGIEINNVVMYFIDVVAYVNILEFAGLDIENLISYVNTNTTKPFACNPHSTWVISAATGNTVGMIRNGNRKVRVIGALDCTGSGYIEDLILGISAAVKDCKDNHTKHGWRCMINISANAGTSNSVLNAAVTAAYKEGVPVAVSAGNTDQNACGSSPAGATGAFVIGATQAPGDVIADFSDYGTCVNVFLPGDPVTVIDPYGNGTDTVEVYGTSLGAPQGTADVAVELSCDPNVLPNMAYDRVMARTVTSNQMQVMTTQGACPAAPILSSYTTTAKDNNKFNTWYSNVTKSGKGFCVRFTAIFETKKGWIWLGLRRNANDLTPSNIKVGAPTTNGKFVNAIYNNGIIKTEVKTNRRIVSRLTSAGVFPATLQIQQSNGTLLVGYESQNSGLVPLLSLADNTSYQDVAFSSGGNSIVKYANVVAGPC